MGRDAEINEAKRQKALLDAAATARLFDRFGRPILLGGEYEFHDPLPPVYMLQEATPDLRRNAQPGAWILTMTATLQIVVFAGQRTPRLTLVQMPAIEPTAEDPADPDAAAASDAPAGSAGSSIILTDMDKTARATLGETEPASSEGAAPPPAPIFVSGLTLVPQQAQPPAEGEDAAVAPATPAIDHGGEE